MRNKYLLLFIYVVTVLFVFYCSLIYSNSISNKTDSVFNDVTSSNYDILYNNIYNYGLENDYFTIYVSFDSNFDEIDYDNVLYIDASKLKRFSDLNRLISDFGYDYSVKKSDLPIFITFSNNVIVRVGDVND